MGYRGRTRTISVLGVRFSPLSLPWERRLQTLVVAIHIANFTITPWITTLTTLYGLFTKYWFISLGLICWQVYDTHVLRASSQGGRRSQLMRTAGFTKMFKDYFPVSLEKTADIKPDKNYIFGYHPHGIIGCGAVCNFGSEATGFSEKYPGITPYMLTLKMNFTFPFIRALLLWLGCCDVSKESLDHILGSKKPGQAAVIVIGGAAEALDAHPGNYDITLKNRKGFIKMALEHGSALVPTFSFGENDLYNQADNHKGSAVRNFQDKFKKWVGFSPPFFYGRGMFNYTFGMLPHRKPITTVVGAPIDVPQIKAPGVKEVEKYHEIYMDKLSELFDSHKTNHGVAADKYLRFV